MRSVREPVPRKSASCADAATLSPGRPLASPDVSPVHPAVSAVTSGVSAASIARTSPTVGNFERREPRGSLARVADVVPTHRRDWLPSGTGTRHPLNSCLAL